MNINLNTFTSNVANGRALINEHYDAQASQLNTYVEELNAKPEQINDEDLADDESGNFVPASRRCAPPELKQYAKAFRNKAFEEIKRVKDKNLKHCETLWSSTETDLGLKFGVRLRHNESVFDKNAPKSKVSKIDLIKRELFSKIFCFVVNVAPIRDMYRLKIDYILVVVEFFLSPSQVMILQNRLNKQKSDQLITLDERYLMIDFVCTEIEEQLQVFKESRNLEFFDEIMRIKIDNIKSLKEICFVREDIRGICFEDNNIMFPKLKLMDLSSNMIEHLSEAVFNSMPNLEYIDLSSNQLTLDGAEIHVFKSLKNCRFLYISRNPISKLDSTFFNYVRNLEDLAISELNLSNLDGSMFFYLKNLIKLNASGNQIQSLDKNTFLGITQLTTLCLSNNKIDKIEENTFAHLTTLKILRLDENQITRVQENWLACLTNLEELDLSNNKIAHIEQKSFSGMVNLKQLSLGGNLMGNMFDPSTFANLQNLKTLRLERNGITNLGVDLLASLSALETLCMNRNELKHLDENAFKDLSNLKTLDLAHNKLARFNINIIEKTPKLKTLVLIYNPISNYAELEDILDKHEIRIVENF